MPTCMTSDGEASPWEVIFKKTFGLKEGTM
jgi:hypothetical protein